MMLQGIGARLRQSQPAQIGYPTWPIDREPTVASHQRVLFSIPERTADPNTFLVQTEHKLSI